MLTGDHRARSALAFIRSRLRRELRDRVQAQEEMYEAAEATGRAIQFPNRQSLVDGGGSIGEIRRALRSDDVDRIPDEYLPYLCNPAYDRTKLTAKEAREVLEGRTEATAPRAAFSSKPVGGRPKKEFWDDLLIDVIRPIYEGEWKPKSVEEIVRRMQDWLIDKGESAGETALKERARKIKIAFISD